MSKVFFISDTHFGQERSRQFSFRPFNNVDEMDEKIIEEWNNVVSENDTVYHLGDFGEYSTVKKLNGKVILLMGNYEENDIKDGKITREKLIDMGFHNETLLNKFDYWVDGPTGLRILMTHKPKDIKEFKGHNAVDIRLFGHIHRLQIVKRWGTKDNYKYGINVGVDGNHFRPWEMSEIINQHEACIKHYDEEVWC